MRRSVILIIIITTMLQSCGNNKTVNESAIVNADTLNVSLTKDLGIDSEFESQVIFNDYKKNCTYTSSKW